MASQHPPRYILGRMGRNRSFGHESDVATMRQGGSRNTGPFTDTYPCAAVQVVLTERVVLFAPFVPYLPRCAVHPVTSLFGA